MKYSAKNKGDQSGRMLRKLRVQFVLTAMTALIIMQGIIICISINHIYDKMLKRSDKLITSIYNSIKNGDGNADIEARYFYVTSDKTGSIKKINNSNNRSVNPLKAAQYYKHVKASGRNTGIYNGYRYRIYKNGDSITAVFLLRTSMAEDIRKTLQSLITASLIGIGIMFIILVLISKQMVKPIAKSYKKQKEFITSASHELKTPITVILADADILQMDHGDNEWVQDIKLQAERLKEMTTSLVCLARMDEKGENINRIDFPISDVAEDIVNSYKALALDEHKRFSYDIMPQVSCFGDENSLRQLMTILLDNAFKYCSDNGEISFLLSRSGNTIEISVRNNVDSANEIELDKIFDRFYRSDSTASKVKGYGLGLSIASAIVSAHKGNISARADGGDAIVLKAVIHSKQHQTGIK